jgi:hypothetical protein
MPGVTAYVPAASACPSTWNSASEATCTEARPLASGTSTEALGWPRVTVAPG